MFYLSGWIDSYIYGALLANFQPDVLNPLVVTLMRMSTVMFLAWKKKIKKDQRTKELDSRKKKQLEQLLALLYSSEENEKMIF